MTWRAVGLYNIPIYIPILSYLIVISSFFPFKKSLPMKNKWDDQSCSRTNRKLSISQLPLTLSEERKSLLGKKPSTISIIFQLKDKRNIGRKERRRKGKGKTYLFIHERRRSLHCSFPWSSDPVRGVTLGIHRVLDSYHHKNAMIDPSCESHVNQEERK